MTNLKTFESFSESEKYQIGKNKIIELLGKDWEEKLNEIIEKSITDEYLLGWKSYLIKDPNDIFNSYKGNIIHVGSSSPKIKEEDNISSFSIFDNGEIEFMSDFPAHGGKEYSFLDKEFSDVFFDKWKDNIDEQNDNGSK